MGCACCMCRHAARLRPRQARDKEGGAVGLPGQGAQEEGVCALDVLRPRGRSLVPPRRAVDQARPPRPHQGPVLSSFTNPFTEDSLLFGCLRLVPVKCMCKTAIHWTDGFRTGPSISVSVCTFILVVLRSLVSGAQA